MYVLKKAPQAPAGGENFGVFSRGGREKITLEQIFARKKQQCPYQNLLMLVVFGGCYSYLSKVARLSFLARARNLDREINFALVV